MDNPAATRPGHGAAFAARHPRDRAFYLTYLAIIWAAMLLGFGLDAWHKFLAHKLTYHWSIHVHAVVFTGWLVLFTAQVLQVETGQVARHRQLGRLAAVLTPAMLVMGPWAAIAQDAARYGHPKTAFPFMITQFTNVGGAVVLIAAGLWLKRDPAAHRRLMLMSVMALMEPGLSRIFAHPLRDWLGEGLFPYWASTYIGSVVLMLGIGLYDRATRGSTHPAWRWAFGWCLALEWLSAVLYYQPWWAELTTRMLGH